MRGAAGYRCGPVITSYSIHYTKLYDLVKKPQKVFWGGYSGYFKDPDGHLWEVAHNPFFWVGPADESV